MSSEDNTLNIKHNFKLDAAHPYYGLNETGHVAPMATKQNVQLQKIFDKAVDDLKKQTSEDGFEAKIQEINKDLDAFSTAFQQRTQKWGWKIATAWQNFLKVFCFCSKRVNPLDAKIVEIDQVIKKVKGDLSRLEAEAKGKQTEKARLAEEERKAAEEKKKEQERVQKEIRERVAREAREAREKEAAEKKAAEEKAAAEAKAAKEKAEAEAKAAREKAAAEAKAAKERAEAEARELQEMQGVAKLIQKAVRLPVTGKDAVEAQEFKPTANPASIRPIRMPNYNIIISSKEVLSKYYEEIRSPANKVVGNKVVIQGSKEAPFMMSFEEAQELLNFVPAKVKNIEWSNVIISSNRIQFVIANNTAFIDLRNAQPEDYAVVKAYFPTLRDLDLASTNWMVMASNYVSSIKFKNTTNVDGIANILKADCFRMLLVLDVSELKLHNGAMVKLISIFEPEDFNKAYEKIAFKHFEYVVSGNAQLRPRFATLKKIATAELSDFQNRILTNFIKGGCKVNLDALNQEVEENRLNFEMVIVGRFCSIYAAIKETFPDDNNLKPLAKAIEEKLKGYLTSTFDDRDIKPFVGAHMETFKAILDEVQNRTVAKEMAAEDDRQQRARAEEAASLAAAQRLQAQLNTQNNGNHGAARPPRANGPAPVGGGIDPATLAALAAAQGVDVPTFLAIQAAQNGN